MQVSRRIFLAVLFMAAIVVSLTSAVDVNATPGNTLYITIDPIGAHVVGDMFVIKGTTNLPPTDSLRIVIDHSSNNPSGFGSTFQSTVPITLGENSINFWSCNVPTTTGWVTFRSIGMAPTQDANPDNYVVIVGLSSDFNVSQYQYFDIFAPGSDINLTSSPTPISAPSPVLQKTFQTSSSPQLTLGRTVIPPTAQASPVSFMEPVVVLALIVIISYRRG